MSHDFVEAAFLQRAGWEVWMAPDLAGSYEEPPPTVYDHLKRDRRWAQGNLQHARILLAQGLNLPSRLHLAMGIMSYLASPLWLLLLVVSALEMFVPEGIEPFTYAGRHPELALSVSQAAPLLQLVTATLVLLYAPEIAGADGASDPAGRRQGTWRGGEYPALGGAGKHLRHLVRAGGDAGA